MENLTIRTKLAVLVLLLLVAILFVGLKGILNLRKINEGVDTMYANRVLPLQQLKKVSDAYAVSIVDIAHKSYHDLVTYKDALKALEKATKVVSENWSAYEDTYIVGEEKKLMAEAIELRKVSKASYHELVTILQKGKGEKTHKELDQFIKTKLYQTIDPYTAKISELIDIQLAISKEIKNDADLTLQKTTIESFVIIIVAIVIAIGLSVYIINGINSALKNANGIIRSLSEGDLTVQVSKTAKDEIGILLTNIDKMIQKLRETVASVMSAANNIAAASEQMSTTSQQISQASSDQASSFEEVSTSMEQMAANIQNNTENAHQTKQIALLSAQSILEGSQATNTAVVSMKNIAEKIQIISDIAFQTNILALNAAVEAARAGVHGKGFAVVAAEVRKLAERSKYSAEEIGGLTKGGVDVAEKAGVKLGEIVPDIERTAQLVQEIAIASSEQNSGAGEVNHAMQQLNSVTQQNAAASEEMATSSRSLANHAEQLKDMISFFRLGDKR